ncbi:hypothetical protein EDEG_03733 [Edhazardia aedis USNM 41457]|uniref:Uncharacterized protein n=1 Tax=Edhazardia aedis (strain USNM 41457) TaxID=1003232 RepID=J9DK61_EDHAE|nr:hypothetical protein EDEG_03733 [Edhazardia aedis USNM 41457]|eukprot:EJW01752.1 hypothetical protein EDEG_03733 [Edhazardia aedis USNM 41457]
MYMKKANSFSNMFNTKMIGFYGSESNLEDSQGYKGINEIGKCTRLFCSEGDIYNEMYSIKTRINSAAKVVDKNIVTGMDYKKIFNAKIDCFEKECFKKESIYADYNSGKKECSRKDFINANDHRAKNKEYSNKKTIIVLAIIVA